MRAPLITKTELEAATDPEALRAARVQAAIEADNAASAETDEARRAERLSGLRCSCCDEEMPASVAGDECAACAAINS